MAGRRIAPRAEDDMNTEAVSVKTLATIAALSGVCFLASLFLPCIYVEDDPTPFMGLALFLWGPFGILDGVVAWYANPFLALMALLLVARRYSLVALFGIPCLTLALSTLAVHEILINERPTYATITGYGLGFYLWLASLAIPPSAAIAMLCRVRVPWTQGPWRSATSTCESTPPVL
jgi:hypothetical protein